MSDILIALAFIVFTAASFFGSIMWSVRTLENRADRIIQGRIKRDRCDITENGKECPYNNLAEYERDRAIQISYGLTKNGPEDSDEKRKEWERANQRVTAFHIQVWELMASARNRAYETEALLIPFPDSDLPDSLVKNDHKENEGTQH